MSGSSDSTMCRTWPGISLCTVLYATLTAVPELPDMQQTCCSISAWQSAITWGLVSGASRDWLSVAGMDAKATGALPVSACAFPVLLSGGPPEQADVGHHLHVPAHGLARARPVPAPDRLEGPMVGPQ